MFFRGSEWRHCQASGKHSKFLCQQAFIELLLHRGSTLSWDSRDPKTWLLLWVFRVYRDNRKTEKGVVSNLVEGANHMVPKGFQVEGAFGAKRLPESGSLREMQVMGWRKGARGPEEQVQRLSATGWSRVEGSPSSMPCESPFTSSPLSLARQGPGRGRHPWSNLAGSQDSEERVEEGRHQGRSSKGHRLGHPVHGGHDQHISAWGLLEGEESGWLETALPPRIQKRAGAEAAVTQTSTQALEHRPGGGCRAGLGGGVCWIVVV